jgi:hypothetical protein
VVHWERESVLDVGSMYADKYNTNYSAVKTFDAIPTSQTAHA